MSLDIHSDDYPAKPVAEKLAAILSDTDRHRAFSRFDDLRVQAAASSTFASALAAAIESFHDIGVLSDDARAYLVTYIVMDCALDDDDVELYWIERERDEVMARLGLKGHWLDFRYVDEIWELAEDWRERVDELVRRQLRCWGCGDLADLMERDEERLDRRSIRGEKELWGNAAREVIQERIRAALKDENESRRSP